MAEHHEQCYTGFPPGQRRYPGNARRGSGRRPPSLAQDASCYCSFLSIHGYPFYLSWVDKDDVYLLPFLGIITSWLGGGRPVLFQEFGWPNEPAQTGPKSKQEAVKTPLWSEEQVNDLYHRSLSLLHAAGTIGALGWCFADYHPQLYGKPPLQENAHERYFGLTRWMGQ